MWRLAGAMMFAPLCIPGRLMFNLRSMDLNLLTVFEAIYEKASVRGAAGKLGLSQSATSHALARLRETLDDELFKKAGSGLAPTPVARALFPAVQRSLASLRLGLADARGFHPAISRREFRISNPHPAGPFHALLPQHERCPLDRFDKGVDLWRRAAAIRSVTTAAVQPI